MRERPESAPEAGKGELTRAESLDHRAPHPITETGEGGEPEWFCSKITFADGGDLLLPEIASDTDQVDAACNKTVRIDTGRFERREQLSAQAMSYQDLAGSTASGEVADKVAEIVRPEAPGDPLRIRGGTTAVGQLLGEEQPRWIASHRCPRCTKADPGDGDRGDRELVERVAMAGAGAERTGQPACGAMDE